MKIQLSQTKIIPDAVTVWNEPGPEIDLVYDLKKLGFRENSVETIYSFNVIDHYFPHEIPEVLANWHRCLKPGGKLWLKATDFETICREYVGGGITIDLFNEQFTRPAYITRESAVRLLTTAGFDENNLIVWFDNVPNQFLKGQYELVFECKK